MTKVITVIVLLLFSGSVYAQQAGIPAKWEVSLNFAPRFNPEFNLINLRREVTINTPRSVPSISILLDGVERHFERGTALLSTQPAEHDTWFAAQLKVHRRLAKGFDVSAGFLYAQRSYVSRPELPLNTPSVGGVTTNYVFDVLDLEESTYGLLLHASYHLFAANRFHSYFGMGFGGIVEHIRGEELGKIYTEDPTRVIPPTTMDTSFDETGIVELDFYATMGLLYQINNGLGVGVEINSRLVPASGLALLHVRHGF